MPDYFYSNLYNGVPIYSEGILSTSRAGSLIVKPVEYNGLTMLNCRRGIVTLYSSLGADSIRMDSMYVGVQSTMCKNYLSTTITNCEIRVKQTGINWQFNAGAKKMTANNNRVYSISSIYPFKGINLNEGNGNGVANYMVKNNFIYLYQTGTGIKMQGLYQDSVIYNYMEQNLPGNALAMGVHANRCNNSYIQCNQVRNFKITNNLSRGYNFSLSNNNIVSCNSADSTGKGFYFGGQNNSTQLSGNTMRNNELGLYVANGGVIGVQSNTGNKFIDYRDTVGAFNANGNQNAIYASRFFLKNGTSTGSVYYPILAQQNTGWFFPNLPSNPYVCGASCFVPHTQPYNELFYRIVAGDSVFTDDFVPENQSMARQYLFEVLSNDSVLLNSDTLFRNFYDEMAAEAEGQLNVVERNLGAYGKMGTTFEPLLATVDSLNEALQRAINEIETVCVQLQVTNCDSLREAYAVQLENLQTTRLNIITQYLTVQTGQLQDAELVNNLIAPDEVPEIHSNRLNEIFIALEEQHYGNVNEYYNELLSIAEQCPYYGGEAVYRARAILELMDETIIYNDDANCLLYGYYRKSKTTLTNNEQIVSVKPNPANNYVEISVSCSTNESYKINIIDVFGKTIYSSSLLCNNSKKINTTGLAQGVYNISIVTSTGNSFYKLAIIR